MTPTRVEIYIGALLSAFFFLVYNVLLSEPGALFYGFAALVFIGCPLVAGIIAYLKTPEHKIRRFAASSGLVFGISLLLFIVTYAVLPQFDRANLKLPVSCDGYDGVLDLPLQLAYSLPGGKSGILLVENEQSVLAATIDGDRSPFASTVYLVRKGDRKIDNVILRQMPFNSDIVMAALDAGTLYLYNDKLGYLIDERTGDFENNILLIDNYGGLTETDKPLFPTTSNGDWFFETKAVVSSWGVDGTVKSRPHLTMTGISMGCYVSGATGEVVPLGPDR